jgi:hypothetical protein
VSKPLVTLTLRRNYVYSPTNRASTHPQGCTVGQLYANASWLRPLYWVCTILELPNLQNLRSKSCVPEGEYTLYRDTAGRHQWYRFVARHLSVFHTDAEAERHAPGWGRSHCEWHPAPSTRGLQGCGIFCMGYRVNTEDYSASAFGSDEAAERIRQALTEPDGTYEGPWALRIVGSE